MRHAANILSIIALAFFALVLLIRWNNATWTPAPAGSTPAGHYTPAIDGSPHPPVVPSASCPVSIPGAYQPAACP
jgi:hypothetical protein